MKKDFLLVFGVFLLFPLFMIVGCMKERVQVSGSNDTKNTAQAQSQATLQDSSTPKKPVVTRKPKNTQDSQKNKIQKKETQKKAQASQTPTKSASGLKFSLQDIVDSKEMQDYNYTGTIRLYHNNGALAWEISFKEGKQDGWTKWYYDNNQVRAQMFFTNGDANGALLSYYRHGVMREEGNYSNDLANGESKLYTPSGALQAVIIYKDGVEVSRKNYIP